MPSAYHVHPEFGYFCLAPYRRRELRVAIVSILFGAIIGGSIATLRAGHDRNPGGASTAVHVDVPNSERVLAAAAEATPAATNDTKAGVHQALSDAARARASSRAEPTHPGNGCHSPHTGRSNCVSLTARGATGERTRLGTASRFISRDEVGGGAADFHRGQEAAKDRTGSKPPPH
jgi:hypothetical protein